MDTQAILQVENLQKHFPIKGGLFSPTGSKTVKAVDGVSFSLARGQTLGLVGESGCGKSTTGRMVARLMDPTGGRILIDGVDISQLGGRDLYNFRRKVQMIFQDPFASLNPRQTVGTAIAAPMLAQKINPAGGRDHHPGVCSIIMGGGPIKGGQVIGESDELGYVPKSRPVTPGEVAATLFKGLGLDPHRELPGPQNRPLPLVEFSLHPIKELF